MITVVLIIHLIVALTLVAVVLLQRSEGGALGIGGGGGFLTGRGTGNFLTRATGVLAAVFFLTSIVLAILAGGYKKPASIFDSPISGSEQPQPQAPQSPAVPLSR